MKNYISYWILFIGGEFFFIIEEFIGEVVERFFESLNVDIFFVVINGIFENNVIIV